MYTMESKLNGSGVGAVVREEMKLESTSNEQGCGEEAGKVVHVIEIHKDRSLKPSSPTLIDLAINKLVPIVTRVERSMDTNSGAPCPIQKDQEDQLVSSKAQMVEFMREENERLKTIIAQTVKDYQSLQMHFFDIVHKEAAKTTIDTANNQEVEEHPELVSLSLGRISNEPKEDQKNSSYSKTKEDEKFKGSFALGLDCKFDLTKIGLAESISNSNPKNSSDEEPKEVEVHGETWPPSKLLKTMKSEDDGSQESHVKKARVSIRVRCDTRTINDGCQWRKYGQKIAKANPCPRAYYRCTIAPACPVRKQVQRCAEDMSILVTTYEGTHNHPLPDSATAMASTTSAAASMLLSGSSSSRPDLGGASATTAGLHGLNFNLSYDNSRSRPFYLPSSSISSSPSYPTITLDLTANPSSSSSSLSSHLLRQSSNFLPSTPRYSSTNLNFSSSEPYSTLPMSWGSTGYPAYGIQSYNKTQIAGSLNLGRQPHQEQFQQLRMQNNNSTSTSPVHEQSLTDSISAATKAITSDPSFRSALAAAITSSYLNKSS